MIRLPAKKYRPITQFRYYQIEPTLMNVLHTPSLKSWIDVITIFPMCAIFKAMNAARGLPSRRPHAMRHSDHRLHREPASRPRFNQPNLLTVHANVYATQPLAKCGSREQLEETIPDIISGKRRTCFGVTEPNAGLNTLGLVDDGSEDRGMGTS